MSDRDNEDGVLDVKGNSGRATALDIAGIILRVLGILIFGLAILTALVVLSGSPSGIARTPFLASGLAWGFGLFLAGLLLSALSDLVRVGLRTALNTEGFRRPAEDPARGQSDESH